MRENHKEKCHFFPSFLFEVEIDLDNHPFLSFVFFYKGGWTLTLCLRATNVLIISYRILLATCF